MTAQKKREILTGGIAALLIVCAVAARVVTRGHREAPYFLPVSLLRSLIYIGLMTWWGVSLWQRIVQTQVRRYLAATAALCVFWLSIRTVKFFFAATPAAIRYLWYGYYVPMLFIPLLCVLVALSLGKPENYRLPKWTGLLYLPTTLLLLLVLTNDLHHTQADAISKLSRAGIVTGSDKEHNCKPNTNIRRSEVAAILTRMPELCAGRNSRTQPRRNQAGRKYRIFEVHAAAAEHFRAEGRQRELHCRSHRKEKTVCLSVAVAEQQTRLGRPDK